MYSKLVWITCILAFCAVVLSAYARLSDAGLGCTNWPACYEANALKERQPPQAGAARSHATWQWKLHSQVVQLLGLLAIAVSGLAWKERRKLRQSPWLPTLLVLLMAFMAVFGIWAFSRLPRTIIVPVHLAGGVAMMMMLTWMVLRQSTASKIPDLARTWLLPSWLGTALLVVQIMLGGWVSSNFAALACSEFPLCQGSLLPPMDFSYHVEFSGVLPATEKLTAIHWMHRVGALFSIVYLGWLAYKIRPIAELRSIGVTMLTLVVFQSALGVLNVLYSLPLLIAVLHNATAMLLLAVLVTLNFRLGAGR